LEIAPVIAIRLEVRFLAILLDNDLLGPGRQLPFVLADEGPAAPGILYQVELDSLPFLNNPKFAKALLFDTAAVLGQRSIALMVVVVEDYPEGDEGGDNSTGDRRSPGDLDQRRRRLIEVPLKGQRPDRHQPRHHQPQQQKDQDQREHRTPQISDLRFSIL